MIHAFPLNLYLFVTEAIEAITYVWYQLMFLFPKKRLSEFISTANEVLTISEQEINDFVEKSLASIPEIFKIKFKTP